MNTAQLNNHTQQVSSKSTISFDGILNKWFTKQAINFENTRFGMMSVYMILQSCIAAIAAMYILKSDASVFLLSASAALAMASNAMFIAQGSAKLCLAVFYLSLFVNVLFIVFCLS